MGADRAVVELAILALVGGALHGLLPSLLRWPTALQRGPWAESVRGLLRMRRPVLVATFTLLALGLLTYNGWLLARGIDARGHTLDLLRSMTVRRGESIGLLVAKVGVALVGLLVATRAIRRLLRWSKDSISHRVPFQGVEQSLSSVFTGLERVVVTTGWMLLAVLTCHLFAAPPSVTNALLLAVRLYLVIALGLIVIRSTPALVNVLHFMGRRYMLDRGWAHHYEPLRPLVSTFRTYLEYALWIGLVSLTLRQAGWFPSLAGWGPPLMQAVGLLFLGHVVVGRGTHEIEHRMLPPDGLDETERRRRATMVPLIRSTFTYAVYFGVAVLVLGTLGFNPMPFLAGAGILGLVVGFGAQSLINDVVSGFFILFENVYLVGDAVEAAGAKGIVEAIEFRTTKIRDAEGRLHVIRNGDMKLVVNYSKNYAMAVVPVEVPYDSDVRAVFDTLRQAAERLRADHPDVLARTEIDGITNFGSSTMTVRTRTRVKPGRHEAVAAALRLSIKEAFDGCASGTPRKGLIPEVYKGA